MSRSNSDVIIFEPMTDPQRRILMTLTNSCFGFSRDVRLKIVSHIVGKPVESITHLSKQEATRVIDMFDFTWKIAEMHNHEDNGYDVEQTVEVEVSKWIQDEVQASERKVAAIMRFAERYLHLTVSQQIELAVYVLDRNLETLFSMSEEEAEAMWQRYRFGYKLIRNYPALMAG